MSSKNLKKELFEHDRRAELKMRLALKRLHGQMPARVLPLGWIGQPEPEVVGRLIDKVQRL